MPPGVDPPTAVSTHPAGIFVYTICYSAFSDYFFFKFVSVHSPFTFVIMEYILTH